MNESIVYEVNEKGMRVVRKRIEDIGKAGLATDNLMKAFKRTLVGFSGIAILRDSLNTLRNFSQEMSTVKAVTGATEQQFKSLRDEAKLLGSTTKFSATEAAQGMAFLARAGFDTDQVLNTVGDTLNLAQAGALGLAEAADISSNILTGFRLEASQLGNIVDILAFQANNSNTNIQQLGEAMKFAAPIAAGLGVNAKDASAAIGALSDAGLQASLAGTGLRTSLLQLENPTTSGKDALKSMGLSLDEVSVKSLGLLPVLKNLRDANLDVTKAVEIAGTRGGPALDILVNSLDKIEKNSESLNTVDGYAKNVAKTMNDNLNGAVIEAGSAFEGLKIAIGDIGAESGLTDFFKGLANSLRFISSNIEQFARATKILITTLITYKITVSAASAGTGIFTNILKKARIAMLAFNAAVLANPLGIAVLVIGGAITALVAFSDQIALSSDGLVTLGGFAAALFDEIKKSVSGLKEIFKNSFNTINKFSAEFFNGFTFSFESVIKTVAKGADAQIGIFKSLFSIVTSVFRNLPNVIVDYFFTALNRSIKLVEDFANAAINILNKVGADIKPLEFKGLDNPAKNTIKNIAKDAKNIFLENYNDGSIQGIINRSFETARLNAKKLKDEIQNPNKNSEVLKEEIKSETVIKGEALSKDQILARETIFNSINDAKKFFNDQAEGLKGLLKDNLISSSESTLFLGDNNIVDREILGLELYKSEYERVLGEINTLRKNDLLSEEQTGRAKLLANNNYLRERLKSTQSILGQLSTLSNSKNKKAALIGKTAAISQATIDGFLAVQKALSSAPPPLNFALAAATGVATAANIANIKSQPTGFRTGGSFSVGGNGGPDSQLVPILASPNETVTVSTPKQIRRGEEKQQQNSDSKSINIINLVDKELLDQYLNSSEGNKTFINKIEANSTEIKQIVVNS